eukprot:12264372-Heterocapsa_arctica.AAC.1
MILEARWQGLKHFIYEIAQLIRDRPVMPQYYLDNLPEELTIYSCRALGSIRLASRLCGGLELPPSRR